MGPNIGKPPETTNLGTLPKTRNGNRSACDAQVLTGTEPEHSPRALHATNTEFATQSIRPHVTPLKCRVC
eukprot:6391705-Prymnesium_polylepis.1